jgi:hypothetical protein
LINYFDNESSMLFQQGYMNSNEPSRYMTRLCYHFSKKIEVQYDEVRGLAHFPWGRCTLTALEEGIRFVCEADDAEKMTQVRNVIDSHVVLFSRRAPLQVVWEALQGEPGPHDVGA